MDHAVRAELSRSSLHDHVPAELQHELAREYATERMRVLATTSPVALAERRDSAVHLQ